MPVSGTGLSHHHLPNILQRFDLALQTLTCWGGGEETEEGKEGGMEGRKERGEVPVGVSWAVLEKLGAVQHQDQTGLGS